MKTDSRGDTSGWINICCNRLANGEACSLRYWYNAWRKIRYAVTLEGDATTELHVCRT